MTKLAQKIVLIPVLTMLLASCTPGEKSTSSTDSTSVDSSGLAAVTSAASLPGETNETNSPAWNLDTLINILIRDSIIGPGSSAELTATSTVQLDKLNEPNSIQGVGIVANALAEDGAYKECVILAFFNTSENPPKLITHLNYGERIGMVSFGKVQLTPGQFATTASYDIHEEGKTEDSYTREDRTEVTYFALKAGEVVPIFDYLASSNRNIQGPEGSDGNFSEENIPKFGTLKAGQLCSITLVGSDPSASPTYILKGDQYLER